MGAVHMQHAGVLLLVLQQQQQRQQGWRVTCIHPTLHKLKWCCCCCSEGAGQAPSGGAAAASLLPMSEAMSAADVLGPLLMPLAQLSLHQLSCYHERD